MNTTTTTTTDEINNNRKKNDKDNIVVDKNTPQQQQQQQQPQQQQVDAMEKVVDSVLDSFHQSLSTSRGGSEVQQQRQQYRERLCSFQSSTYFAKPCQLSPIIVACFGWTNVEKDLIRCHSCRAVVAVIFHPLLSKEGMDKMIAWYEKQLAEAHSVACPFRHLAMKYYSNHYHSPNKIFTKFLPPLEVELLLCLEQQSKPILRPFLDKIMDALVVDNDHTIFQPFHNIPPYILAYPKTELESSPSLLSRIVDTIGFVPSDNLTTNYPNNNKEILESIVLLVLFGWRLHEKDHTSQDQQPPLPNETSLTLTCSLCLATLTIPPVQSSHNNNETDSTTTTTTTTPDSPNLRCWPWNAHRYYCPYLCGGPRKNQPLWQNLADKLLLLETKDYSQVEPTTSTASPWMQVHSMLQQGLAINHPCAFPKKRRRDQIHK